MNRRDFMKTSALLTGGLAIDAPQLLASTVKPAMATRLTILHTNDVHSHLEPMASGKFAGLGGAPARAALVEQYRQLEENVLVLDAGDMFQGTPYFNLFEGEAEVVAMNGIGYDAGTIGNHEFDAGIDRLAEVIDGYAEFPILNSNYDFSNTPMAGLTKDHQIIEKAGMRIGLFGLGIKLDGLVMPGLTGEARYLDPLEHAKRVATFLREEKNCDFIICLSHINLYDRRMDGGEIGDRGIIKEVPEIDVVIGGHNHILLPVPEAHYRGRKNGMGFVAQANWGGTHVGVLQFDIFQQGKKELTASEAIEASDS